MEFRPRVFAAVAVLGGLVVGLASRYGMDLTHAPAAAPGLQDYPNSVAGVVLGLVWMALFALGQALSATAERRER